MVVETTGGQLVDIEVNNNAAYGYDVRGEVVGEKGTALLRAPVHAAMVEIGSFHALVRVVALSDEAILGRDVLNQVVTSLNGPGLTVSFRGRSARSKRRPRR